MDRERVRFVFGDDLDLDDDELDDLADPDLRGELIAELFGDLTPVQQANHEAVITQLLSDDPPEVWATAQRLAGAGLDPDRIINQLGIVFTTEQLHRLDHDEPADPRHYVESLARLPLPSVGDIESAAVDLVRSHPGLALSAAIDQVLLAVGEDPDFDPARNLVDRVLEQLFGEWSPLVICYPDQLVEIESLVADKVLTHRLTDSEVEVGWLNGSFDLWVHRRRVDLVLAADGRELDVVTAAPGQLGWYQSRDWLEAFGEGTVVAVRVGPDGAVALDALPQAPAPGDALIEAVRAAVDRESTETGFPVNAEELVVSLLLDDPAWFDEPEAPLSELVEAAGLERRGAWVAADPEAWWTAASTLRFGRVDRHFDHDRAAAHAAHDALDVAERLSRPPEAAPAEPDTSIDPHDPARLRSILRSLGELGVLSVVSDELFNPPDVDPEHLDPRPFIDALARVAPRGEGRAVVAWFEALAAEGDGQLDAAQAALEDGVRADPGFVAVVDRLAWYLSTRGEAARAARLWRSLGEADAVAVDLANVDRASAPAVGLGRNEPCWCGSGRKFKQCHLGQADVLPLPERVGWLCRKGVGFVERRGAPAQADVIDVALALASDPSDPGSLAETFDDPLAMDLVLTEGGWWEEFLDERGALLPDDEAWLAESWTRVPRTVYEIEAVRLDVGLTVRDLRSGEHLEVTERSFTHQAEPGLLLCARAVPDGAAHQFIGGPFEVPPGREVDLLEVLDEATAEGDPTLIAEWVAALRRPPVVVDAEGNVIADLADPATLRRLRRGPGG